MKRSMIFFNQFDCGCSPVAGVQTGYGAPCIPPANGAVVVDERYRSLITAPALRLLGVPLGGNSQAFLTRGALTGGDDAFLVIGSDGQAYATRSPHLPLPIFNPAVSGAFPVSPGFQFLLTIGGGNAWGQVAAPTAGEYILQSKNGSWVMVDAGSIPGITTVAQSATFAAKANVLGTVELSPGVFAVRKIKVTHNRALIGDVDGSGNPGYMPCPEDRALQHPIGKFQALQLRTYEALDESGALISGGMPQADAFGAGDDGQGYAVYYFPDSKRLMKAPQQTAVQARVTTSSASTNAPVSYGNIPGGHGVLGSQTFNYPVVRLTAHVNLSANEAVNFAFFRDGTLIGEFTIGVTLDSTFEYLDVNVPAGPHTYDLRWKRDPGATSPAAVFKYSDIAAYTVSTSDLA